MSKKLINKIKEYIAQKAIGPAQKTKEWYDIKQKTIGGSEVATVLGINPFKNVKALIAEKVGIDDYKFDGNINTRWGNLFEVVTKKWTELVLCMDEEIFETGSIEGVIERQRYSPDGLGVVKLLTENNRYDFFIVLFEFKSPLRSIPDGKIPKYYRPQIQTGMLTIPIVETSIFVNNCYRKCALKDIGFSPIYDNDFHDGDYKKLKSSDSINVLGCGIIGFYQTRENYDNVVKTLGYNEDTSDSDSEINFDDDFDTDDAKTYDMFSEVDIDLLFNSYEEPLDYGQISERMMKRVLELQEEKKIHAIYYPIVPNTEELHNIPFLEMHDKSEKIIGFEGNPKKAIKMHYKSFIDKCDDNEWIPIGYLPWKLIKSDILCEDRDETWKDKIEGPIKDTLGKIDKILASDNPEKEYENMFPTPNAGMQDADIRDMLADIRDMIDLSDVGSTKVIIKDPNETDVTDIDATEVEEDTGSEYEVEDDL